MSGVLSLQGLVVYCVSASTTHKVLGERRACKTRRATRSAGLHGSTVQAVAAVEAPGAVEGAGVGARDSGSRVPARSVAILKPVAAEGILAAFFAKVALQDLQQRAQLDAIPSLRKTAGCPLA